MSKLLKTIQLLPKMKKPAKGTKFPKCGIKGCDSVLTKQTHDTGYKGAKKLEPRVNPPQRTKRGRPRLPENQRIQFIGWYCKKCKMFYYPSGNVIPESITLILNIW